MKKYEKLINLLINMGDCIVFEIETYDNLFNIIDEHEIYTLYTAITKNYNNLSKTKYEDFRQLVITNDLKNKQAIYDALKSIKTIESEIIFKCSITEYGFLKYNQNMSNLIIGCKNSELTKQYLLNINSIWNWTGSRPSNFSIYKKGKCVFQLLAEDKCIFVSNLNIFNIIKNMYSACKFRDINDSCDLKYPYELNDDDTNISIEF